MGDNYARIEIMGHQVITGRVTEVTRYGVQFCAVERIDKDGNLGCLILHGGSAIFRETPLTREEAIAEATPYWERVAQLPEHEDEDEVGSDDEGPAEGDGDDVPY